MVVFGKLLVVCVMVDYKHTYKFCMKLHVCISNYKLVHGGIYTNHGLLHILLTADRIRNDAV